MNTTRQARFVLIATILGLLLSTASAQQAGKKEYAFKGKVCEKIDADAKKITVFNEKVDGWMGAMSMSYSVDKPDVLSKLKVGDQIVPRSTKVISRRCLGVQPAPAAAAAPKK